jgi:NADH-quinone oxidoreductase subunit L
MLGLVLILPLASFVLSLIIPERYSWLVSITAPVLLLVSIILGAVLFFSVEDVYIRYDWFYIGTRVVNFSLQLDSLSRIMIITVTTVSFLVHVYSVGYMAGDADIKRYFAMLGFFTFAMLGIVLVGNLILLFVFWELVGFSSYLLIGHWMEKPEAAKAAHKAFLFNRIGDAALLVGILMVWTNTDALTTTSPASLQYSTAAGILIFCGVIAKSAQLPLFSWLPDAMEGPTPVSALLHAATMVAAGIFLLIRLFPFFTDTALIVMALTGSITAVFAALCALNQFDIKKILAYSTISQLGLMITAIGVGAKDAALLHLFTHAFFKAGLFLAAGSVIHVLHHYQQQTKEHFDVQDIRNLGGLRKKLPFTFITFCITGASLAGIPLLSGFLSKDSILIATASLEVGPLFTVRWILTATILLASFITVLYTFRMIWFIFFGNESKINTFISEAPWVMRVPMGLLALASCWFIISVNPFALSGWFTSTFAGIEHSDFLTTVSAFMMIVACIVALILYRKNPIAKTLPVIQHGFGIDAFYQKTIGLAFLKLSVFTETADRKWIDGFLHFAAYGHVAIAHGLAWFDRYIIDGAVNLGAWFAGLLGSFTRSFQGGKIQLYIFWAVTGLIIFLFFALI